MPISMKTSRRGVEHINPVVQEGDCEFTMQPVTEHPQGGVNLSLVATRTVCVYKTCETPISKGRAEMMEWMRQQMTDLMEMAKKELKVDEKSVPSDMPHSKGLDS